MDDKEVCKTICQLRFMQELPEDLREKVSAILQGISELRTVPQGKTWIREGEHTQNKGYILLKGSVGIRKADYPAHAEDAPELLGEIMQFNPAHLRAATVVAAEDSVLMSFLWDDFWASTARALPGPDQEKVKAAVGTFAWEHFTR